MGIISDSRNPEPVQPIEYIDVGGAFDCQTCGECVDAAKYSRETFELAWVCSKGHISKIGDFDL